MLTLIIIGFVLGGIIAIVSLGIQQSTAEKIDCPKCGKRFRLVGGSYKCPKCRTRVTRTKNGDLTT